MYRIGIVAHTARQQHAQILGEQIRADLIQWDDGTIGCNANHRATWAALAEHRPEWLIVLEDDAILCDDFNHQLGQALNLAPANIVSLYLGRTKPALWQGRIEASAKRADKANATWIIGDRLLHAVAVGIRTELVPAMLKQLDASLPIDDAISKWAKHAGEQVAYTWPSLIDHRDEPSLIPRVRRNTGPRRAWRHGTPDQWTTTSVRLTH